MGVNKLHPFSFCPTCASHQITQFIISFWPLHTEWSTQRFVTVQKHTHVFKYSWPVWWGGVGAGGGMTYWQTKMEKVEKIRTKVKQVWRQRLEIQKKSQFCHFHIVESWQRKDGCIPVTYWTGRELQLQQTQPTICPNQRQPLEFLITDRKIQSRKSTAAVVFGEKQPSHS